MNLNNHGIPILLYYLHLDTTASTHFAHMVWSGGQSEVLYSSARVLEYNVSP